MSEKYGPCKSCGGSGSHGEDECGGCEGTGFYGGCFDPPQWKPKKERDKVNKFSFALEAAVNSIQVSKLKK